MLQIYNLTNLTGKTARHIELIVYDICHHIVMASNRKTFHHTQLSEIFPHIIQNEVY